MDNAKTWLFLIFILCCSFYISKIISLFPSAYSFIHFAIVSIHKGCTFKQGIISNFSPPACMKDSLPSSAISSNVSRQSLTKAGHTINNFFTPSPIYKSLVELLTESPNSLMNLPFASETLSKLLLSKGIAL